MKKILVIDDQQAEEINFDSLLSTNGFNVHIALGRSNGAAIARRYLPDLIICNLESETEGADLIKELNLHDATLVIPLIYLSSDSRLQNQRRMMNLGADDYIVKPFLAEDLLMAVKMRIQKHEKLKDKMQQICQESLEGEEETPLRKDHILVKIGNRLQLVKFSQIVCITALKEYSKIRTFGGQNIIVRKSLKAWIDILPSNNFLRIHRTTIINVDAIEQIMKVRERSWVVQLKTIETPFDLSQRYANIMRKTFSL